LELKKKLLPLAALVGAALVIEFDLSVRLVFKVDLMVGILTWLSGCPYFLCSSIKHRKRFEGP
jgi:ABC-type Fe3+-siderophore transport system permease subunit